MVCPGECPRLNQGLHHHHRAQVQGFEGLVRKVPQVMASEGGVLALSTCLHNLGDSEVLLEEKRLSDTMSCPGPRRRVQ